MGKVMMTLEDKMAKAMSMTATALLDDYRTLAHRETEMLYVSDAEADRHAESMAVIRDELLRRLGESEK